MYHTKLAKAAGTLFTSTTLKQIVVLCGILAVGMTLFSYVPETFAQTTTGMIDDADNPENIGEATNNEGSARALARTIVNFFLFFLGLVATIMVIYGGVLYVTAAGNDDQVGKAKNVILYAIAGIIVILLSFALVNTVILGAGTADPDAADPQGTGGAQ